MRSLRGQLLFLDEITSGLDSANSLAVVALVKRLCAARSLCALSSRPTRRPSVFVEGNV